jgi:single-strand DNA-binding protein
MAGLNKVMLIGRLGQDPEIRYTTNGTAQAKLRLATTERWTNKEGEKGERTEWHNIVVWGKQAELCAEYLSKGRQVYIEGRLQTRTYDDKEGKKRYITEVKGDVVQFLDSRGERMEHPAAPPPTPDADVSGPPPDDIPF